MCRVRDLCIALFVLHSVIVALVSARGSNTTSRWQTLSGAAPLVVARGGFSGLFPDSSSLAYALAIRTSVSDLILWCDVQLTKDGVGVCFPYLKLDNSSNIADVFKNKQKEYLVDGVPTRGWFSVDFNHSDLENVFLTQGIYSRTAYFDSNLFQILTVQDVRQQMKPSAFWLNIEHDAFYLQHNLSMRSFVLSVSRTVVVDYISSPEVGFLRSIAARFAKNKTKLVFRFRQKVDIEPSTNQTYESLLKNLTFIKTFASGIIVPKSYIWPLDSNLYLQPSTSVVSDAHKAGLEVFASDFVNDDAQMSYNYSYDPLAEYLNFIDNGEFSVDGVISDFPITPSAAIDCFAHLGKNAPKQADLLIITKFGASGDYPGCTDLAYLRAIDDGADVIDCPVQMTKDGIPICLPTINLIESTNAAQSSFSNLLTTIPEIQQGSGIFTFSLTWNDIQTLKPSISNPQAKYQMFRNPKFKDAGNFVTLSHFLALTKNASSLSGVLISIENAAYLAEKQNLSVTNAVLTALSKAGYDQLITPKVMIQSPNSSVLKKVKGANYELVYKVDETIRGALNATVEDIKSFAQSVVVDKISVLPERKAFLTGQTDVVAKLQSFKLPVYVETFSNEFISQAWDFFSDATVEINSFYQGFNISGVVTDFPKTSARYRRNRCLNRGNKTPPYMLAIPPAGLLQFIAAVSMPPAEAPYPILTEADVVEPPLPAGSAKSPSASPTRTTPAPLPSGQPKVAAISNLAMLLAVILLL
ncbi:hypothetical protein SLEP1_g46593 [Rubroshorea leprosula]|uniref:glycerophosphodiester phosphodiesterase n=1 Tax=Rubroshorea leprosula TaxID=152421 RepID=A0AAV5LPE4_9ROSI|nr:hypothetical protein SLEP1_g46593 [Rubroshorea leprosula]